MALPQTSLLLLLSLIIAWPENAPAAPVSPAPKEKLPEGVRALLGNVPAGRGDAVEAVAFSPDSRRLASAHRDHTLRLWDAATGKKIRQFPGPGKPVAWLLFSPNGRTLLTGSEQGAGEWDTTSGKRLSELHPTEHRLIRIAYMPDGRSRAWTEDAHHTLHGWDVQTRKEICSSSGHRDRVCSVVLSPDGTVLASSSQDRTVRLWDATSGKLLRQLQARPPDAFRAAREQPVIDRLQFAPNGWMLYGTGEGANYYLWEMSTGSVAHLYDEQLFGRRRQEHAKQRRGAQVFSADSRVLLWFLEGQDGSLSWHDIATFASIGGMGTESQKKVTALAFAPDGSCLAIGSDEGSIGLWEGRSLTWNHHPLPLTLTEKKLEEEWKALASGDGRRVYSASWDLALASGQSLPFLRRHLRPATRPSAEEIRKLLAALDDRDEAKRNQAFEALTAAGESAEAESRKALQGQPSAEVRQKISLIREESSHPRLLRVLQILEQINTPPARQLLNDVAGGAADAWLTRQAATSCKRLADRPVAQEQADTSAPQPETPLPKLLVTEGPPAVPLRPGKDLYGDPLPPGAVARIGSCRLRHQGGARAVAFSPDGKLLASGGADKAVRVWSTADGEQKQCLRGHDNSIIGLTFSSDGKLLASGAEDGNIVLWDVRTGRELDRLSKDGVCLAHLAFTPDNHFLAAVGCAPQGGRVGNGQVFLWDLTTGRRQQRWEGEVKEATSAVAFTPRSKSILLGHGGVLSTHDLSTGKQQQQRKVSASSVLTLKSLRDGRTLAAMVGEGKRSIDVIDASNGREVRRFDSMTPPFRSAAIDARGRWLAVGGDQYSSISLHDLDTGKTRWLRSNDQQVRINSVAFSADGKLLASADEEGIVQLWDVEQGEERLLRNRPLSGLYGRLSPDGRIVATLERSYHSHARSLCLWEAASGRLLRRLATATSEFQAIAFSADSKTLAAAVGDGFSENTVLLLESATGKLIRRCRGKTRWITFLAFAPDGQRLAGEDSERLHLWDVRTGKELPGFSASASKVRSGAFSSDGKVLATASEDGSLHIRDAATGREIRRLVGHGGFAVAEVAFSPDGRLLASVGADGFVSLWDARTYERLRRLPSTGDWLSCVAFSADSRLVAADNADGFLVWEANTGRKRHQISAHADAVFSLAFAVDGKTLASGSRDGTVLVWDVAALAPLERSPQRPQGRTDRLGDPLPAGSVARLGSVRFRHEGQTIGSIVSVVFSPDGKTMATGSAGNSGTSVRLWDVASGRQLRLLKDYPSWIHRLTFSPDGRLLAGLSRGTVTVWDAASGERRVRLKVHEDDASCFAFSPDSKLLATADQPYNDPDKKYLVRLWDVTTGREIRHFAGHHSAVGCLVFSADGKRLASCGATDRKEANVLIWDLESGRLLRQFQVPGMRNTFSPDGRMLAVLAGKTIRLWDLDTQKPLNSIAISNDNAAFCFSSDGQTLAVDSDKGTCLYRIATGELLRRIASSSGHGSRRFHMMGWPAVFSPDGKTLVTIDGTTVRLWDVGSGRMVRPFGGHRGSITCLSFAPDGKTIVSGSEDGTVRLWEARTGREVFCFEKHEDSLAAVAFSPDGRSVASADHEGTIILWRAATGEECHRLRGLPGETKSLYFAADGRRLLACTAGGGVCVWDTDSGKVLQKLKGEDAKDSSCSVALSPDGRWLLTARTEEGEIGGKSGTNNLHYRSLNTGRILRSIRCPEERYDTLTFTADGQFLAAMGYSIDHFHGHVNPTGVRFWEVATGAEIFRLKDLATPFAFSPDGRVVVCPSRSAREAADGVQCWDVATRRRLGQITGHLGGVTSLAFSGDGRLLATGSADETILVWDADPVTRDRPPPCPAMPQRLEELWADLAGADAARAHDALWSLVHRPAETLPFLRAQLHPIPLLDGERVKRWIADLDSDQFDVRRRAAEELERLGELAGPSLRAMLGNKPSLEVRRTIEPLLEKMEKEVYTGEPLRMLRAIAVLERIGNAEARRLLDTLSHGATEARVTQQAHAAVQRLARRTSSP